MRLAIPRSSSRVLLLVLALARGAAAGSDEAAASAVEGFTGVWSLVTEKDDIAAKARKGAWDVLPGAGSRGTAGGGFDLPLESMTDARRLVVDDDGTTFRATYPSGRKRTFVTDGQERYLDDGDGPATVTAKRKAMTVSILSVWFRGYRLSETWELRAVPRRLVVSGRVRGRSSQDYVRTYEPASPEEAEAPAGGAAVKEPAPTDASSNAAPAATPVGAPPAVDRLAECTIRPPRRSTPEELRTMARVSQKEAGEAAVASLAPLKPGDVLSSDVEAFEGCLVWPFTMRLLAPRGVQEVFVDAGDGKVVRSEFVPTGTSGEAPAP